MKTFRITALVCEGSRFSQDDATLCDIIEITLAEPPEAAGGFSNLFSILDAWKKQSAVAEACADAIAVDLEAHAGTCEQCSNALYVEQVVDAFGPTAAPRMLPAKVSAAEFCELGKLIRVPREIGKLIRPDRGPEVAS